MVLTGGSVQASDVPAASAGTPASRRLRPTGAVESRRSAPPAASDCLGPGWQAMAFSADSSLDALLLRLAADYPVTPVARVSVEIGGKTRLVDLKLEGRSPWGSIKGRTAIGLMRSVARRFDQGAYGPVVESTSGNLGVALAAICREAGLRFIAVVDPKLSPTIRDRLLANGATLEIVMSDNPLGNHLNTRIARVAELCRLFPRALTPNQYENLANRDVHTEWTGPEWLLQCECAPDAAFIAVSTGGTLAGVARAFRATAPSTRIVAVDSVGSLVFSDTPGVRWLTGIGSTRKSRFIDPASYDEVSLIDDTAAVSVCRALAADTGIAVGGSSGAALAAAVRYLTRHDDVTYVTCLCPDDGDNYTRTIYDDCWLAERSLVPDPASASAGVTLRFETVASGDAATAAVPGTSVGRFEMHRH